MSISNFLEDELLDHVFAPAAYTAPTNIYVKLHIGDPGETGTGNPAVNTTRQEATFGTASGGAISNDNTITWTSVATNEDYTYFSLWDNVSAGNCLWTGTVTANAVSTGDTFTIAVGDLDITLD